MKLRNLTPRDHRTRRASGYTFCGWGIIGEPKSDVLIDGPSGPSLDVTGYDAADYWDGEEFRGPDSFGIVPVYRTPHGHQFPADAKAYPYLA